jgi:hypothetical protein
MLRSLKSSNLVLATVVQDKAAAKGWYPGKSSANANTFLFVLPAPIFYVPAKG